MKTRNLALIGLGSLLLLADPSIMAQGRRGGNGGGYGRGRDQAGVSCPWRSAGAGMRCGMGYGMGRGGGFGGGLTASMVDRLPALASRWNLTETQRIQAKKILEAADAKTKAYLSTANVSSPTSRTNLQAIRQGAMDSVYRSLTADQKKALAGFCPRFVATP